MESILEKKGQRRQNAGTDQESLKFRERLEASKATYRKPVEQPRDVLADAARRREARKKPNMPVKSEKRGDAPASRKSAVSSSRPRPEAEAAPEGERNYDWPPCLRCMGRNLPCSFVHNRSAGSDIVCTCCERLGEGVFCIQVATVRAGRYYGVEEVTSVQLWPAGWRSDDGLHRSDLIEVFVPIPDLTYSPDEYEAFVQTAQHLINGEPGPLVVDRLGDGLMLTDTENWMLPSRWNVDKSQRPLIDTERDEEAPAWQVYFQQLQQQRKERRDGDNEKRVKEYRAEIQKRRRLRDGEQAPSSDEDMAKVGDHGSTKEEGKMKQESPKKEEEEADADCPLAYTSSGRVLRYLYREREKMKKYAEAFDKAKKEKEAKRADTERMAKRGLLQIDHESASDGTTAPPSNEQVESEPADDAET
ncbi:hypothetical protein MCOR25_007104 [Pyricularia grisea]|nr:hypothetical protein MCOR25_007104 [Pyricularia grisea]